MGELTTSVVKQAYVSEVERWGLTTEEAQREFDKWLASVKAQAIRDVATGLIDWDVMYCHEMSTADDEVSHRNVDWLMSEADRIEKGV